MVKPVAEAKKIRAGSGKGQIHAQLVALAGGFCGDEDEGLPAIWRWMAMTRIG